MANLDREVELQIRAEDNTSKTIASVRKSLKKLRDDLSEQRKAVKSGTADMKSYEASLKGLETAANQLASLRQQINNLQNLKSKYKDLNGTLSDLQKNQQALSATIGAAGVATKAQAGMLNNIAKKIATTAEAMDKIDTTIKRQSLTLRQYGVDTRNLQSAHDNLTKVQGGVYKSIINARVQLNGLKQTNAKAAEAIRQHAAAQAALAEAQRQAAEAAAAQKAQQQAAAQAKREQLALNGARNAINAKRESLLNLVNAERKAQTSQADFASTVASAAAPQHKFAATLSSTRQAILQTRKVYQDNAKDADKLKTALGNLAVAQKRLVGISRLVDEYNKVRSAMQSARAEYDALRQKQAQLNAAMRGGGATHEQVAELKNVVAAMNQLGAVYAKHHVQFERLQADLKNAGVNVANLAGEQRKLVNSARASAQAVERLQGALGHLERQKRRVNEAFKRGQGSGRTTLDIFQRLRGQVLALTSAYIGLYGAIDLFNKVIQAGKDGYKLKVSAEILEDNGWAEALGGDMEKYFRETSERMGLSLKDVVQDATKFFIAAKEAGRDVREAAYTWEQFTGFGKLLGLDNVTMGRVNKALEQMFTKGNVSAEELKQQLGDALPAASALFAKALGVTTGELMKLMEDGKVTADTLVLAAKQIDEKYGTKIAKSFDNLQSAQNRLNNAWEDWLRLINDAGVSDNFKNLVVEVTSFLRSDDGKRWAMNFATAINTVIDGLRWCVKNVDLLIGALTVLFGLFAVQSLAVFSRFVIGLSAAFGKLVGGFSGLLLKIGIMMRVLPNTATAVGGLSGAFTILFTVLKRVFLPLTLLVGAVKAVWEALELGTDAASVFRQIGDACFVLGAIIESVASVITTAFKGAVHAVKYVFTSLFSVIKKLFGGFSKDSKKSADDFEDGWKGALDILEDGFSRFVFKAMGYLDKLVAYSKASVTYLGGLFDVVFGETKWEDLSFDNIRKDALEIQRNQGYQKEYLDKVAARKREQVEAKKNKPTETPDTSGITGIREKDDEKEKEKKAKAANKMLQELERQRERVERERTKAEQAALKRLEKQLEYQKALEYYAKSAHGHFKNGQDKGNYADYMMGQYNATLKQFAASRQQDDAYLTSLAKQHEAQIAALQAQEKINTNTAKTFANLPKPPMLKGSYSQSDYKFQQSMDINRQRYLGRELKKNCALGVRTGLETAFKIQIGKNGHAKEFIGNLLARGHAKKMGYREIAFDPRTYVPQVGDIMSMHRTSTDAGRKYGHVAVRGMKNWYADGLQRTAYGNTIAFKPQDYQAINRGEIKVRVLRLADKSGTSIPASSLTQPAASAKGKKTSDNSKEIKAVHDEAIAGIKEWIGNIQSSRQESAFEQNLENFADKAKEIQEKINEKSLETIQKLFSENGFTIDAAVNMASVEIGINNQLTHDQMLKAFQDAYQPELDKQADETAALLYARLHETLGVEQAKVLFTQLEPKIRALYAAKAKEELGKVIEQRFDATVGEAQKFITAQENRIKTLQAQILNGSLTPEAAAKKMLEYQTQNTKEIEKQIAAIDAFLASADGKLDPNQHAKFQAQREQLAASIAKGGIGQPNTQRDNADQIADTQITRINALLSAKNEIEKQHQLLVQAGVETVSQANERQLSQYQAINKELLDLAANSQNLQIALADQFSPEQTTRLSQAILDAKTGAQDLGLAFKVNLAVGAELQRGFQVMFESAAKGVAGLITGQKTLAETFGDLRTAFLQWVSEFLMNIAKMILQQAILTALQAAAEKNPAGSGIIATLIQGAIAALGGVTSNVKHDGGMVGFGKTRHVSPLLFANAPRYHTGGVVGLKPNEVPAILQRGEEVLTRADPRHRYNANSQQEQAQQPITVVNTINPEDALREALSSRAGQAVLLEAIGKNRKQIRQIR